MTPHPITPHKGGRTSRLPGGKVTPDELAALESDRAARGLSWSDYVLALKREADVISSSKWAEFEYILSGASTKESAK